MFERYEEKSFYRIIKVETLKDAPEGSYEEERKMKVWAQKVFRGRLYPKPLLLESATYKSDFKLLPKREEKDYCQIISDRTDELKIVASTMELPPLLKELVRRETGNENVRMNVRIKKSSNRFYRKAKEGETPTMELPIGIGKPLSPELYKGIEL